MECCRQRDREVSWQSFSPESEPFEARSRGKEGVVSLWSSGSKPFVRHLTSESMSQDLNRRERLFNFCLFACLLKWTLNAGEKLSERDPENAMANRYLRELSSKADVMNFSLRTTFFGERKHGQAPAEHFLSCVSFQHVHSVLPESVKA